MDARRQPLLIDPSAEDPWDHLYFDGHTGNITARYDPVTRLPHGKGVHTVDPDVLPLNIEAVTEGRQRTRRNLMRAVNYFLMHLAADDVPGALETELVEAISDNDDYGLAIWYFRRDGTEEEPFRGLKISHPAVWNRIGQML